MGSKSLKKAIRSNAGFVRALRGGLTEAAMGGGSDVPSGMDEDGDPLSDIAMVLRNNDLSDREKLRSISDIVASARSSNEDDTDGEDEDSQPSRRGFGEKRRRK